MKFFTEKWYNDTVLAEMCFQLRKTQKAAEFSEKFYEKLYNIEKKAFLKHTKRAAKFEKIKFDVEASGAQFDANYEENLAYVKANLPEEILGKIADIRILALGSATYDMVDEITRFCGRVNRKCEKITSDYDESLEPLAEEFGWYKINALNMLSNAPVESVTVTEGSCEIVTSPEYTGVSARVVLTDASVIENPESLLGAAVIRTELTKKESGDGLEFGLLCIREDGSLVTFLASMNEIEVSEICSLTDDD